ncbi:PAS domain S-box protein [Lichenihabitans sp. PAMC28606]|uniref:sensor histidine kinase n=1 Tax=Lichenihabitans sp. PAMC28606 TaxID=2880932 RepID=UPI001D0AF5DF|nr:HWE histidine kinase domain-containing protein [Lichenihabitans sp. PAMC28606]UDL95899.1 PAS domain S-box protein [Lichenihabitans sp. PAMC28606]
MTTDAAIDDLSSMTRRVEALATENARLRALLQQAGLDLRPESTKESDPPNLDPHARQAFTRLLIDSISGGFYAVDVEGRTTLCNRAAVHLLGFDSQDEVIGHHLHDLAHHSHADGSPYPAATCPIYRAAREGTAAQVTGEVFFRRDGTSFPVEYRAEPIKLDGVLQGAICTFTDITARTQSDADLRESRERLALALDAAGIGIWDFSPASGRLEWDDRVRALFGLSAGRAITIEMNLNAIHPADKASVDAALAEAFDPSGPGDYDIQFRAIGIEDGVERWMAAKGRVTFVDRTVHRFLGAVRDISDEKRAEMHMRLMVNELNHRVKNSLAMVQGVAAQTFRGTTDMDTARTAFTERLVALAKAHDVLTAGKWESATLMSVVALTVKSHGGDDQNRFDVSGPDIALSPKTVLAMSLALHELATNAVKYGSLSNDTGRVTIRWSATASGGDKRLLFRWEERGGPPVVQPQRRGFGSKLIERGLAAELQGDVRIEFRQGGIVCTISAPFPSA